ncbi:MAG: hypothetical protein HKN33_16310 [Pyrinomonadaceae bacterium]|nr:hypothetical protein [Pyrinomonadaceae bacterium]
MKRTILTLFFVLVFSAVCETAYSQGFPYHLYAPRTLSELNDLNTKVMKESEVEGSKNLAISAKPFYSAIRLQYAGKSRSLSKEKAGLFKIWAESLNVQSTNTKSGVLDIIKKEYLFRECEKEYWLTVQTPAANDFPKDMADGDLITLYLMVVGGIETKGKWESIYLTNSFKIYQ